MQLDARGKINWTLDILGRRADGYHLMDMLMQPVTLADTVTIEPGDALRLTCGGYPRLKPTEEHLAMKAARALQQATGCTLGASLHVHKRIPVGAGMGGGSADAAAVLYGLNKLWGLELDGTALEAIGVTLGADVPFCLRGGLVRTTGIGEVMQPIPCGALYWLVVIQPCRGLSTREVFTAYHGEDSVPHPDIDGAQQALASGSLPRLKTSLRNVLQPVSMALRPPIGEAIQALQATGAEVALMTGSGSAVFGVFRNAVQARTASEQLRKTWRSTFMCHTCMESIVEG